MSRYVGVLVSVVLLANPVLAGGHGFIPRTRTAAYYAPPVVQYVPVATYVPVPVCAVPVQAAWGPATQAPPLAAPYQPPSTSRPAPPGGYAPTTAAPPSTTPTPAPAPPNRGPAVTESRSYYDTYALAPRDSDPPARDRCSVTFWNLSGRDLSVKVDGQARTLTRGQSLAVDVGRQFSWQVEGRDAQKENVAMGEPGLEIVIRR